MLNRWKSKETRGGTHRQKELLTATVLDFGGRPPAQAQIPAMLLPEPSARPRLLRMLRPTLHREGACTEREKEKNQGQGRRSTHQNGRINLLALDCDGYPGRSMWFLDTLLPEPRSRAHLLCRLCAYSNFMLHKPMVLRFICL